ncbi:hypothetical protein DPMN_060728 [Dreissena polymorpha]|uniref:Uncharacterized protein n=1 Tax=Dreissena polymorpha TaxID=45954 RepID=A0A9D4HGD1_DREPO|nr:hypothetical protein DPMN_060728 [Dreissena polymorpha]
MFQQLLHVDADLTDVLESSELAVVMMSGEVERTEHVHVKSEAFLQVGGVFTATLRSVKLVTGET